MNVKQQEAIYSIVNKTHIPFPFIIFGPPGTGKTLTLCEAIVQIFYQYDKGKRETLNTPRPRVLLVAPSDSAVDTLTIRLTKFFKPENMVRISSWKRKPESLPASLLAYSPTDDKGYFIIPPIENPHDIIACTCTLAGLMKSRGYDLGGVSHIIMDEASQATEPETYLPLQYASPTTSVTLAGDPFQLGPSVRDNLASNILSVSLQERLLLDAPYRDMKTSRLTPSRYLSILDYNYRSHESILLLSSRMFYESRLLAFAGDEVNCMLPLPDLRGKNHAVLFYGINGHATSVDSEGSSLCNMEEV